ncbi:MAG: hypothetical protein QG657_888 [Acidobacteriota bacterium]|nr:hypothetical protein [Acidobacteriota bacterium]
MKQYYDPIVTARETAGIVCQGDARKYYRFRPARFYGGIATADCVGCNLRCLFCWSWKNITNPGKVGYFYTPDEVAEKLVKIARDKGFRRIRISGNEPTIAREHLLRVLALVPADIQFILETNGILIGHDKTYANDLSKFKNLYVRVSLKGTNEKEFSSLTGANPMAFELQLNALANLYQAGVKAHPAVMASFSSQENIKTLQKRLGKINRAFEKIEIEELSPYGGAMSRLPRKGRGAAPLRRL